MSPGGGPMEFGMFHEFQCPPGASAAEAFQQSFEQVDAAERWGLDAMWLAELHFAPERSVLASPLILAAAIAQRTTRMKIGTAVQVLPLCHPLRLRPYLQDLQRRLRREPRALRRNASHRETHLHRGPLQPPGQVLRLRQR